MYLHVGFDETAGNQTSSKQENIILNWMLALMQKFDYLFFSHLLQKSCFSAPMEKAGLWRLIAEEGLANFIAAI